METDGTSDLFPCSFVMCLYVPSFVLILTSAADLSVLGVRTIGDNQDVFNSDLVCNMFCDLPSIVSKSIEAPASDIIHYSHNQLWELRERHQGLRITGVRDPIRLDHDS